MPNHNATQFGGAPPSAGAATEVPLRPTPDLSGFNTDAVQLDGDILQNWTIREQRPRNTCVAFAVSSCMELYRKIALSRPIERLSPQFLYHKMRTDFEIIQDPPPGYDEGATRLHQAMLVMQQLGLCTEALSPYEMTAVTPLEGKAPNKKALGDAKTRKHANFNYGIRKNLAEVWQVDAGGKKNQPLSGLFLEHLHKNHPVVVGLSVVRLHTGEANWDWRKTTRTGTVLCPADDAWAEFKLKKASYNDSGHVFCITGYRPDPGNNSGGWFTFRNSWAHRFGTHRPPHDGPTARPALGYGTISAVHLENYAWEYLIAT